MSDSAPEATPKAGLPGWVMTFADLMTLLMCFFVLMLSFSEMDVAKFKQLAGSMKDAFGVQAEIDAKTIPKGTSIIAQEFSPGRPQQTILDSVRQFTVKTSMSTLDVGTNERLKELQKQEERAEQEANTLREALREEIDNGTLLVRRESTNVIVQILERDSFPSGSASLQGEFPPTLARIAAVLGPMFGAVSVSGHTDNVPISTSQYRSNWDLSAARASTVVHELLQAGLDPARVMVGGYADTQPRAPNDTPANRALNRRIDITLLTNKPRHSMWEPSEEMPDLAIAPAESNGSSEENPQPAADSPETDSPEPLPPEANQAPAA
jgi:chemotaxis protein MotB